MNGNLAINAVVTKDYSSEFSSEPSNESEDSHLSQGSSSIVLNGCSSQKCKYHRDVAEVNSTEFSKYPKKCSNRYTVNYLHLDPEKDKQAYQSEYVKLHKPKISLNERAERVKKLIDT